MKLRALILCTLALLSAGAQAATVSITVNSNGGSPYASSVGTLLAAGCVIRVGFFSSSTPSDLTTLATSNVYADVNALFTPVAEGNGTISEAGNVGGTQIIINNGLSAGNVFGSILGVDSNTRAAGTDLWVWVFNNADPLLATEWGIFTSTSGWDFPNALGGENLMTSEINTVVRGTNTGTQFRLAPIATVPEPGSLVLLLSLGAMIRRRRR